MPSPSFFSTTGLVLPEAVPLRLLLGGGSWPAPVPLAGLGLERSFPGLASPCDPPMGAPPCVTERRRSALLTAAPLPFCEAPLGRGEDASGVPVVVGRPAWNWGHSDAPGRPVEALKLLLRWACDGVCERGARSRAAEEAESWSCTSQCWCELVTFEGRSEGEGTNNAGVRVAADEDGELVVVRVHLEVLSTPGRVCVG